LRLLTKLSATDYFNWTNFDILNFANLLS